MIILTVFRWTPEWEFVLLLCHLFLEFIIRSEVMIDWYYDVIPDCINIERGKGAMIRNMNVSLKN